jgi:uncharacterized protein YecT (DUF1311 family)
VELVLAAARRRFASAARVASVVVACGVMLMSGSLVSGAASLKPPVITETFTSLPCHRSTTIGLEGCAEGQLLSTDRRINEQVKLLFGVIATAPQRRNFVAVENQWLAYRKADCSTVSDAFQGGSIAPVEYALCEVRDNEARSADLHSYFALLEEGSSASPAWP